jgi:uncharacterized membrane protein
MMTLIRWRSKRRHRMRVDTSQAPLLAHLNHAELALALVMVFVASAMARGLW